MLKWIKKLFGTSSEDLTADPVAQASKLLIKGNKSGARHFCDKVLSSTIPSRVRCDILQIRGMAYFMEQDILQYFHAADDFLEAALIVDADLSVRASCLKTHQSIMEWTVSEAKKVTTNPSTPPATKITGELLIASAWSRQGQFLSSGLTAVNVSKSNAANQIVKDNAQLLLNVVIEKLSVIGSTAALPPSLRAESLFKRAVLRQVMGDAAGCTADLKMLSNNPINPQYIVEGIGQFEKGKADLATKLMAQENAGVEASLSRKNGGLDIQMFDHESAQKASIDTRPFTDLDAFIVWHAVTSLRVPSVASFFPGKK